MKIQVKLTEEGKLDQWGNMAPYTCIIDVEINEKQKQMLKECLSKGSSFFLDIGIAYPQQIDITKLTQKSLSEL
jgi:hypothetical protein